MSLHATVTFFLGARVTGVRLEGKLCWANLLLRS